jgi:hypothetical protein
LKNRRSFTKSSLLVASLIIGLCCTVSGFLEQPEILYGLWASNEDTKTVVFFSVSCFAVLLFLSYAFSSKFPVGTLLVHLLTPLILLVISTGIMSLLVPLVFVFSAYSVGNFCCNFIGKHLNTTQPEYSYRPVFETMTGLTLYMFILGVLAHFPVNNIPVYAGILFGGFLINPVVCRKLTCLPSLSRAYITKNHLAPNKWHFFLLSLLTTIYTVHALQVSRYEMMADALGIHLLVPNIIKNHSIWHFDVTQYVFSVMPLGVDWLYSFVFVLSGEHAARIFNYLCMLLLAAGIAYPAWNRKAVSPLLLASIIFVSSPLVFVETGSLFVDNLWAALLLYAAYASHHFKTNRNPFFLLVISILISGAFLIKVTSIFYASLIVLYIIPDLLRMITTQGWRSVSIFCFCLSIFILIGGSPYIYAWIATGNPVFPFYNAIFKSPLYYSEKSFEQPTFKIPLQLSTLYDMTFQSHKYLEALSASLGFHYLAFFLLTLFTTMLYPSSLGIGLIFIAAGYFAIVTYFQAYLRYLYPSFVTFSASLAFIIPILQQHHRNIYRCTSGIIIVLCLLHLLCAPAGLWYYRTFPLKDTLLRNQETELTYLVPERILIRKLNNTYGMNTKVVFLDAAKSVYAELSGTILPNTWHNDKVYRRLHSITALQQVIEFAQQYQVTHFITGYETYPNEHIDAFLKQYTEKEYTQYSFSAHKVNHEKLQDDVSNK